jgi:hypothetical protein
VVTRLIGLPEVPGHGKTGVGKWHFIPSPAISLSSLHLQRITSLRLLVVLCLRIRPSVNRRRRGESGQ